jgi:hypothetical protein
MPPTERPEHDTARQEAHLASHLDSPGHKGADSTLLTFLVITLGMALAITLAALHLAGGW